LKGLEFRIQTFYRGKVNFEYHKLGLQYFFAFQIFEGNRDSSTEMRHMFIDEMTARCVRVYPLDFSVAPGLRLDILGCRDLSKWLKQQ